MCKKLLNNIRNGRIEKEFEKYSSTNTLPSYEDSYIIFKNLCKSNVIKEIDFTKSIIQGTRGNEYGCVRPDNDCAMLPENITVNNKESISIHVRKEKCKGKDYNGMFVEKDFSGGMIKGSVDQFIHPGYQFLSTVKFDPFCIGTFEGLWLLIDLPEYYREYDIAERFTSSDNERNTLKITSHYGTSSQWKDRKMYQRWIHHVDMHNPYIFMVDISDDGKWITTYINFVKVQQVNMMDICTGVQPHFSNWVKIYDGLTKTAVSNRLPAFIQISEAVIIT